MPNKKLTTEPGMRSTESIASDFNIKPVENVHSLSGIKNL